jgi:hypothetical protein
MVLRVPVTRQPALNEKLGLRNGRQSLARDLQSPPMSRNRGSGANSTEQCAPQGSPKGIAAYVGPSDASAMLAYLFGRILSFARWRAADDLDFHASG